MSIILLLKSVLDTTPYPFACKIRKPQNESDLLQIQFLIALTFYAADCQM